MINTLNAELIPICHLLALLGAHHILHVSRISVKIAIMKWLGHMASLEDNVHCMKINFSQPEVAGRKEGID
jgi:hypothetical protein